MIVFEPYPGKLVIEEGGSYWVRPNGEIVPYDAAEVGNPCRPVHDQSSHNETANEYYPV